MLLADDFVAYALLAPPGAIFAAVFIDCSSIFCANFDHVLLVFLVLSLVALRIERRDRALFH